VLKKIIVPKENYPVGELKILDRRVANKMTNVEGRNPVIELLRGDRQIKQILIQKGAGGKAIKEILNKAKQKNVSLKRVEKDKLDKMARTYSHQGVIARAGKIHLTTPDQILAYAKKRNESPFIVILDQIQDPQNFGSIIRSAHAAGAHGIIFPERRAVGITPAVVKASSGSVEHMRISQVRNINSLIKDLKEKGVWITGTVVDAPKEFHDVDYDGSTAIVIGNEGSGLRRLVKENCDFLVNIPMTGKLGSLNASVATGIILYEVVRQRR
jgi:23S rRNA (guanosine2251-2'-O)-methyltransferase